MGMYTEIFVISEIKEDVSKTDLDILKFLFSDGKCPETLPNHRFFSLERWKFIGKGSSYYHIPFSTSSFRYDDIAKQYYLVSRSDLKNYDNEIDSFTTRKM